MKRKHAKFAEKHLYEPLRQFLESNCSCFPRYSWWVGCGRDVRLPADFGIRKPDVIGMCRTKSGPSVHLIEAKKLSQPNHGFEETRTQLAAWEQYADYLWAAFPESEWHRAKQNHPSWLAKLKGNGYGLLIVGSGVEKVLPAERNSHVNPDRRGELIRQLPGATAEAFELPALGDPAWRHASRAAARVAELMMSETISNHLRRCFKTKVRPSDLHSPWISDKTDDCFILGYWTWREDRVIVQGDPFGWHLDDGRALIWAWCQLNDHLHLRSIRAAKGSPNETYVWAENDDEGRCQRVSDADVNSLIGEGFDDFMVGRPVVVAGRTDESICNEFGSVCEWARQMVGK